MGKMAWQRWHTKDGMVTRAWQRGHDIEGMAKRAWQRGHDIEGMAKWGWQRGQGQYPILNYPSSTCVHSQVIE